MSFSPGVLNLEIYRRSDWDQPITLKDSSGSAIDLSSYTALAQIWTQDRTKKFLDITCTITNASTGSLTLSLTDAETTTLPDSAYWDLRLTTGTTSRFWLQGTCSAKEGYSA